MQDSIAIALVGAASGIISPLLLALLINRNRRAEKQEDYKRQDDVATQAAEAAKLLAARQDDAAAKAAEAATLLLAANERVAKDTKITNGKLDVIHGLVNSNMTAAMQAELDARRENLALLLEVVEMKRAAGHEPNSETLLLIGAAKGKIAELEAGLSDRLKQSKEIEKIQSDKMIRDMKKE